MTRGEQRRRRRRNAIKAALYALAGTRPCPICDGAARAAGSNHLHSYLRCRRCGLIYIAELPSLLDLRRAYERVHLEGYQVRHKRDWGPFLAHKRLTLTALGVPLPSLGAPAPRALDLGCGEGALLGLLRDLGFEAQGLELNPVLAAEARTAGFEVHLASLEDPHPPPSLTTPFALILMNHLLEHLRAPGPALARVASWLEPGGRLVVETPLRPDFDNVDHLTCFSAAALERGLLAAGLTPMAWFDYIDGNYGHHNLAVHAVRSASPEHDPVR